MYLSLIGDYDFKPVRRKKGLSNGLPSWCSLRYVFASSDPYSDSHTIFAEPGGAVESADEIKGAPPICQMWKSLLSRGD
jgi:hypothetical protein